MTTRNPALGAAFMTGMALFAPLHDAFTKLAGPYASPGLITFLRFLVPALLFTALAWGLGRLYNPTRRDTVIHALRGSLVALGSLLIVTALLFMPLGVAVAIFFVEPLTRTLLAAPILGEKLGARRLLACMAGFAGALIIIRPGMGDFGWVAILPVLCAISFSLYMILTVKTDPKGHPFAIQGYTSIGATAFAALALGFGSLIGFDTLTPLLTDSRGVFYACLGGLVGTISHAFIPYAFRYADAGTLAPIQYVEIISASLFGYFLFGEVFSSLDILGVVIIIGAGLYVILRENQLARRQARSPLHG